MLTRILSFSKIRLMKEESRFVAKLIELKHCSLWSRKTEEREMLFEGQIFSRFLTE